MQKRSWSPLPFHPVLRARKRPKARSPTGAWDDEEHSVGRTGIIVYSTDSRFPEFTGIVTEFDEPIYRFYMPKPGMGFLDPDVGHYQPGAYAYGLHPVLFDDNQHGEQGEETDDEEEPDDGTDEEE